MLVLWVWCTLWVSIRECLLAGCFVNAFKKMCELKVERKAGIVFSLEVVLYF